MEENKPTDKKQFDNLTKEKLAEFLKKESPFVDKNISHDEFVEGIKSRNFKVNVVDDAYELCTRKNKDVLAKIKMICFLTPPLFTIVFTLATQHWWYLIGIVIWYLATIIAHQYGYKVLLFVLLLSIGYWFKQGFHFQDYFTFFSLTFILTTFLSAIEKEYETMFATNSLVDDKTLFREAVDQNKIVVERKK